MPNNIVIFDFDCTITSRHWYYFLHMSTDHGRNPDMDAKSPAYDPFMVKLYNDINIIINNDSSTHPVLDYGITEKLIEIFFGGRKRYAELCLMLKYIKRYNNEIVILSNGYSNDIHILLNLVGIREYFNRIVGIADKYNRENRFSKTHYLNVYHDNLKDTANYVFYVDDDPALHNIYIHTLLRNNTPHIILAHKNFVLFFAKKLRYIFYHGLKKEGTGMSINDMENIKDYIMMYPVMNMNTLEQKVSDIPIIDRYPAPVDPAPVVQAPAPAHDTRDPTRDPFAEDWSDISDSLNGGKYYTLYKKNKNKNNRLSSTKL